MSDVAYLDEQQAAEILRISVRTIQRWRGTGEGPPFIRAGGRRVLYTRGAIDTWAAQRTYAHLAAEIAQNAA